MTFSRRDKPGQVTYLGKIEITAMSDGGFTVDYETPFFKKGVIMKSSKKVQVVAEDRKSLRKKVVNAVDFMLSFIPEKSMSTTLMEASDFEE